MITITESAATQINQIMHDNKVSGLRVGIVGGGCNGFNYTFSLLESMDLQDSTFMQDGAVVVIDPMSLMYLDGAAIDYKISLEGSYFVVDNPNAQTQCGCGSSFGI